MPTPIRVIGGERPIAAAEQDVRPPAPAEPSGLTDTASRLIIPHPLKWRPATMLIMAANAFLRYLPVLPLVESRRAPAPPGRQG
jgi:hypothetical protein